MSQNQTNQENNFEVPSRKPTGNSSRYSKAELVPHLEYLSLRILTFFLARNKKGSLYSEPFLSLMLSSI